ncbi:MAG: DUF3267 domain-containing protein [Candidatus Cloacimonetes bacterium]|nr:DUF3267 domain-containing protein [Candidatus Cloacimonadota bacterium]
MKDLSISALTANFGALPIVLLSILILILPFYFIWGAQTINKGIFSIYHNLLYFIIAVVLGSFLHELLHAIGFIIFGKISVTKIKIGIKWKYIAPFAHCKIAVKAKIYLIALLLPAIVLGIIPAFIALILGIGWLMIYGIVFTILAGGDLLVLWLIRKVNSNQMVQDHPTRCGCYVI